MQSCPDDETGISDELSLANNNLCDWGLQPIAEQSYDDFFPAPEPFLHKLDVPVFKTNQNVPDE